MHPFSPLAFRNIGPVLIIACSSALWIYGKCWRSVQDQMKGNQTNSPRDGHGLHQEADLNSAPGLRVMFSSVIGFWGWSLGPDQIKKHKDITRYKISSSLFSLKFVSQISIARHLKQSEQDCKGPRSSADPKGKINTYCSQIVHHLHSFHGQRQHNNPKKHSCA